MPSAPIVALVVWLAYLLLAGWLLFSRRRPAADPARRQRAEHLLLGALLALQAPQVFEPLLGAVPHFGAREALTQLTWLATLIYWSSAFLIRLEGLQTILVPVAAASLGLCLLLPPGHPTPHLARPLTQMHFAIAMLSYGFFAVAAGLAVLMRLADRALHDPAHGLWRQLPPLLALERLLFATLTLGFILLTATLATGVWFGEQLFGGAPGLGHKAIFSAIAWLIFAVLLWGRHRHGWRGKLAVNWTLAGFAVMLLAYVGSRFVVETLLRR